jgi:rare lipoprotein A (peptidoglycan hydrolase)
MIGLARTALSGVVASVLLMGPTLALATPAQNASGPRTSPPGDHRKITQARHARQIAAQTHRVRRPLVVHPAAGYAVARSASIRSALFIGDYQATAGDQQSGLASWYGGQRWHGNRTSSGNIYDQDALTAAHASLPLGSRVLVTLVGTERNVVVTINDRPGTRRRIIDLSRAAAKELGILERGVAMVTLTPL